MLVLSRRDVEALLDPDRLVDALAEAMADLSGGRASMPARVAALVPGRDGFLGVMPVHLPSAGVLESKLVSLFPRNAERGIPTHQAVVVAFDPETGTPDALMDATYVTAVRTAAGCALATRLLAREDASVVAILGTGVQAGSHARAMSRFREAAEIRVAGRDPRKAKAVAEELAARIPAEVSPADSFEAAIHGADVVCACTHSPEPVVRREWLSPGVHVNSVGYNTEGREVDGETVRDASIVAVESRAAVLAPPPSGSNDIQWPIRDGLLDEDRIVEVGELVSGVREGRTSPEQVTLYKSVGVGVQDAAAAALVLEAARARGAGTEIDL